MPSERTCQMERLRWWIVTQVNRLPGQCWPALVTWATDGPLHARRVDRDILPWAPDVASCRADMMRLGCCYCGKFQAEGPPHRTGTANSESWEPA